MEIVAAHEELSVVGLSVGSNWREAVIQARESGARQIAVADPKEAVFVRGKPHLALPVQCKGVDLSSSRMFGSQSSLPCKALSLSTFPSMAA